MLWDKPEAFSLDISVRSPESTQDTEIEVVKSFYFDFDLNDSAEKEDIASLELFLEEVIGKVEQLGLSSPIKSFTGNGFHLLFAMPELAVNEYPKRPSTATLFRAISTETQACLSRTDWEERIRRIENCLVVIKERMRGHSERIHSSELDRLVLKAKKGCDTL